MECRYEQGVIFTHDDGDPAPHLQADGHMPPPPPPPSAAAAAAAGEGGRQHAAEQEDEDSAASRGGGSWVRPVEASAAPELAPVALRRYRHVFEVWDLRVIQEFVPTYLWLHWRVFCCL